LKGWLGVRKGQITLIVIVGLMILIVFFFFFSLKKSIPGEKETRNPNQLLYELESGLVKDHVTSCIYKVSSDGLERLGANGGFIYSFDGGTVPVDGVDLVPGMKEGVDFVNYTLGGRRFLVAYGLRENAFCPAINYSTPGYPYVHTSLASLPVIYSSLESCAYNHSASDYDGFFGQVSLPKLCSFIGDSGCEVFAKGEIVGLTMQKQLEDFVQKKVPLCLNFSEFEEQFGAELFQDGNIVVKVSVRDSDVQVAMQYPFKAVYENGETLSKVVEYQSVLKVRLGLIYKFIYSVLSFEARDPYYDLGLKATASPFFASGFEFKKLNNFCASCPLPHRYADLFEVFDSKSILNGKPFIFRTVIQDRRPVLEFVADRAYDLTINLPPEEQVTEALIPLVAVDPDDTPITHYFISEGYGDGWREPLGIDKPDDHFFENETKLSNDVLVSLRLVPLFSRSDFGNHTVGVLIVDESGFFDYQWFKIRISDSDFVAPYSDVCFDDCSSSGVGEDCGYMCWISANHCQSICKSDYFSRYVPGSEERDLCSACLYRIYHAEMPEAHVTCADILSEPACVSEMPDCFWILENVSDPFIYEGRCVDDRRLSEVSRSALIQW